MVGEIGKCPKEMFRTIRTMLHRLPTYGRRGSEPDLDSATTLVGDSCVIGLPWRVDRLSRAAFSVLKENVEITHLHLACACPYFRCPILEGLYLKIKLVLDTFPPINHVVQFGRQMSADIIVKSCHYT